MDIGVYPISLASMILGEVYEVTGLAEIGETGVDEQAAMVLRYEGDRLAMLATGFRMLPPHDATVIGTAGHIRLHQIWADCTTMTLVIKGQEPQLIEAPKTGVGHHYQANEVSRCIAAGKTESDIMPLDESLSIMKTMDTLRAQWGLKYPME